MVNKLRGIELVLESLRESTISIAGMHGSVILPTHIIHNDELATEVPRAKRLVID